MKKYFTTPFTAIAILACLSCQREEIFFFEKPNSANKEGSLLQNNTIKVAQTNTELSYHAQETTLDTMGENFTVSTSDSWLEVEKTPNGIRLKVTENNTGTKRIGVIHFHINGKEDSKTFIIQQGRYVFPLPMLSFGKNLEELRNFEDSRKETTPLSAQDTGRGAYILSYDVRHPFVAQIRYFTSTLKGNEMARLYFKERIINQEAQDTFETYLLQEGFEKITFKGQISIDNIRKVDKIGYFLKEKQVLIELMLDKNDNHYLVTFRPEQLAPQNTFAELPPFKKQATFQEINSLEISQGSELINDAEFTQEGYSFEGTPDKIRAKYLYKTKNKGNLKYVQYFFIQQKGQYVIDRVSYYYDDFKFAFYAGLDGNYYPTEEFINLLKTYNFRKQPFSIDGVKYVYYSSKRKVRLEVAYGNIKNLGDFLVLQKYN